ncbi:glutamate synthase subunit alpha [Helicobacter sp. 16-1353]|nr:glutamate synthase subunit alpha [Helicobacter sp. 16-1353]
MSDYPNKMGLYDPSFEHEACGIGAIANIKGIKSYKVISDALQLLVNLEHRGGAGTEDNTGDGAGILLQIPHKFFKSQYLGFEIGEEGEYAVAQLFLSQNEYAKSDGIRILKEVLESQKLEILGFREVPINASELGSIAISTMPFILQVFVKKPSDVRKGIDFERKLYAARRLAEKAAYNVPKFYFCSFSSRTIVYKGMLLSTQVGDFYLDLKNLNMESAIALVHARFSTNTFPSWEKAHPNRYMVHNGEINTIKGNVDSMRAREGLCKSRYFKDISQLFPIIAKPSSDSAMFDNTLEFLMMNGRSLEESFMMMIPEPWSKDKEMNKKKRAFYEYHSTIMEPWDGPASIIFSDGVIMGASLDRNGFRPSRYYITNDDFVILASEVGALEIDESNIKAKSRLEPGKLLLIDTLQGKLIADEEIKMHYATQEPYSQWIKNITKIEKLDSAGFVEKDLKKDEILRLQKAFGYTYDELKLSIEYMSANGTEALASMGVDTPLAVLSKRPVLLYSYFKQLFAQVTNPPLDSIREKIVTSSRVYIGKEGNILIPSEENCKRLKLSLPIITNEELYKIKNLKNDASRANDFKSATLSILFDFKKKNLESALNELFSQASKEIKNGSTIIILSDRGMNKNLAAIPALLATSGLHQYLIREFQRTHISIILEVAEPREIHHFACLLGFGATAINPYLVFESIKDLISDEIIKIPLDSAINNFIKATCDGIIKIASKMGISTLQSYTGAKIFECIGISSKVIDKYFTSTINNLEGIDLEDIYNTTILLHNRAYSADSVLDSVLDSAIDSANPDSADSLADSIDSSGLDSASLDSEGWHNFRVNKEEHLYDPLVIYHLQHSTRVGDYAEFKKYSSLVNAKQTNIRDLMEFDFSNSISIDEVEGVESILKRFKSGAMSYGSISKEAHEALAIAMNRIGGKSNSGEGGEDFERFESLANGDSKSSAIKQVASGRFGVLIDYLVNAKEIQIKIAQGAKPGEGGQLPGEKVYPWIAKARHSTPAVSLISPPPHHDIYSIEDLAQLIYDLKNANRDATISVKLVSESGIGTVAAGVAKAGANTILISGYDGGTGASPRTSIPNAGTPWELGLSEAHQTLILNGLRDRVRLEVDGKLLTGRDLAIATLLGAEEYGFSTALLITLGCTMMRVCNLNTCPFGIATQNEILREKFTGKPEYVINFMHFIANEFREYMAKLGFKSVDEMVGRIDRLKQKNCNGKLGKISLDKILFNPKMMNKSAMCCKGFKQIDLHKTLDMQVILPLCKDILSENLSENNATKKANIELKVSNVTGRSLGTILSSEVTKTHKLGGLEEDTINIKTVGNAGNSFGAFLKNGITLEVEGDVNDYLGKGLSGGKIIVKPSKRAKFREEENIIAGNVCLYGAVSGEVYLDGLAGERFGVRNSGANAVVLGVGQHGLEYMTGGKVVILGKIGRNFAAGMSGGVAYIFGRSNIAHINTNLVDILELDESDEKEMLDLIEKHIKYTDSKVARRILEGYQTKLFFKVMPRDYAKMLKTIEMFKDKKDPILSAFLKITGSKSDLKAESSVESALDSIDSGLDSILDSADFALDSAESMESTLTKTAKKTKSKAKSKTAAKNTKQTAKGGK